MIGRAAIFLVCTLGGTSASACLINTTANCVTVNPSQVRGVPIPVGETLPRGRYNIVMNAPYYGLPRATDGWAYFRVEDDIARVRMRDMEILEYVTSQATRRF